MDRIHANAVRIERLSFLFEAPGYPRNNPVRAALIRENEDLLLQAQDKAGRLLDPIRKEPPPGQADVWQVLRDTESGARTARMQGWTDFRDDSVRRRLDAIAPEDAGRKDR